MASEKTAVSPITSAPQAGETAATDYYFNSYSHYGIHMEMLKDRTRTEAYRDAILKNKHMFEGKVVLDVGCGTGILSMFAAKAGAKKVIGIDCSTIAVQAREIVKENGFEDVITILQGKVEELSMPEGVDKVDIIISEWMGYFLLYESMLNTVLYARDKFGAKDVKLLPDKAHMYICGIQDEQYVETKFNVWNDVHGIDYSYFRRLAYVEPLIDSVHKSQIATDVAKLFSIDINTVTVEGLSFTSKFGLVAQRDETLHALCVHFNTPFTAGHEEVDLPTAPWTTRTHWAQTVMYLVNPLKVRKGDMIFGTLDCKPNPGNERDLDIRLHIDLDGAFQTSHFDQDFRIR